MLHSNLIEDLLGFIDETVKEGGTLAEKAAAIENMALDTHRLFELREFVHWFAGDYVGRKAFYDPASTLGRLLNKAYPNGCTLAEAIKWGNELVGFDGL